MRGVFINNVMFLSGRHVQYWVLLFVSAHIRTSYGEGNSHVILRYRVESHKIGSRFILHCSNSLICMKEYLANSLCAVIAVWLDASQRS